MTAKQKYEHDMAVHKAVVASNLNSGMINSTSTRNKGGSNDQANSALVVKNLEDTKSLSSNDNDDNNDDEKLSSGTLNPASCR